MNNNFEKGRPAQVLSGFRFPKGALAAALAFVAVAGAVPKRMPVLGSVFSAPVAEAGCSSARGCVGRNVMHPRYKGNRKLRQKIRVVVCHSYFSRLAKEPRTGKKAWSYRLQYHGWESPNVQVVRGRKCKTMHVKPGTEVGSCASCLGGRIIATPPMTKSGATYYMQNTGQKCSTR